MIYINILENSAIRKTVMGKTNHLLKEGCSLQESSKTHTLVQHYEQLSQMLHTQVKVKANTMSCNHVTAA